MEKTTYKIGYQHIKGGWVIYLGIVGIISFFINKYFAIILLMLSLLFFLIYKKSSYNKSAICFNKAIRLVKNGDIKNSKHLLINAIKFNKYNREAYFFLGCLFFDEEDYTNALEYLKRGGADEVNDSSLAFVLGRCYYHIENYNKSVEYLESVTYDTNSRLERERIYTLGKAYLELEKYYEAYELFEGLEKPKGELRGETLEYYYFLGVACYHLDKIAEAKKYILMVSKVNRDYKNVDLYAKNL
ncbi:tetratricopeptide repeat protein [Clostridium sp. HBUAS56017]|uniref:tetratricopeptide repeat protein n=1 Tax=Clostridium sp. HBUAS56017 TaxID=2571128 RepID=UPI0011787149|nr:tetratricopeptide repeat protein [Clostridium sp. HBUAS56017]